MDWEEDRDIIFESHDNEQRVDVYPLLKYASTMATDGLLGLVQSGAAPACDEAQSLG